jgi:hypothetical protein
MFKEALNKDASCLPSFQRKLESSVFKGFLWMPAFAGMTKMDLIRASLTDEGAERAPQFNIQNSRFKIAASQST